MLPTAAQGRKAIWDNIDKKGRRIIDQAFPPEIRASIRNDEMKIVLKCGSVWQVVGSDNYDSLVGPNPAGIVFSEYAIADPKAWDVFRPILAENNGWATFPFTPRGRNHGYRLFQSSKDMMKKDPNGWFAQKLTVDDTGVIPFSAIEEDRESGMPEELIQQEYWCSFDAALVGAYYGPQMEAARADGRIGNVPHDPSVGVETWWDLGIGDSMVIGFVQRVGQETHAIDYYESCGEDLSHYVGILQQKASELGYVYSDHAFPHDVMARELGTGKTREEVLKSLGLDISVVPRQSVNDGIDAVRRTLPLMWFDETKCERWIEALSQYGKTWDEKNKCFGKPLHNWASHAADMTRMGALHQPKTGYKPKKFKPRHSGEAGWMAA